jgi:hypothetical protein
VPNALKEAVADANMLHVHVAFIQEKYHYGGGTGKSMVGSTIVDKVRAAAAISERGP